LPENQETACPVPEKVLKDLRRFVKNSGKDPVNPGDFEKDCR